MQHVSSVAATAGRCEQDEVNEYFQTSATYWRNIYFDPRLWPSIYRERQKKALEWVDELQLPRSSRILEIGCGAGFLSIALAEKGYSIDAMDSTSAMVGLAGEHAMQAGVANQIHLHLGDAHALSAADKTYDLVIALGVIPWLHSEPKALAEFNRVLKQGGYLLVTADNNARFNRLMDPISCPLWKPLRLVTRWALRQTLASRKTPAAFQPKRHYPRQVSEMIKTAGLKQLKAASIGFGVVTFAGKQILPNGLSVAIHHRFQRLSNAGIFPFSKTGLHYMVLSRKP